ncbi:MAG TPA: hypothetical protein VGN26_22745 [Armatimonadota bacterium]|jgi:hypothetical protein
MKLPNPFPEDWDCWVKLLPADLEASARRLGAFQRARALASPLELLRLLLCYVMAPRPSLRATVVLAQLGGWADLSAVALFKRLQRAGP